ncbi:MAG: chromate resistance protein ChrB domain-containing protein [Pseudomonadota bacterium]
MTTATPTWLALIVSLPTNSATARMRIWRTLKGLGGCAMRDGAYLLPDQGALRRQLDELAGETIREGGSAWLLTVQADSEEQGRMYQALFGRSEDYAAFSRALFAVRQEFTSATPADLNRALRKLRRDYEAIRAIDYFPDEASASTEAAWLDFVSAIEAVLSPGEPQAVDGAIALLERASYQARTWATRRHLLVDRAASAWLIKRFIDPQASFLWLDSPADCPPDALGFDFDQATFTHVGERVTFEVLRASFGLDKDKGLMGLGAMVHALDAGGSFVPEAAGFEAMLGGIRQRVSDDDHLMQEVGAVLDALYLHFSGDPQAARGKK